MTEKLTPYGLACREYRLGAGKVMGDQAEALGCSVAYISAIERGRRPVPPSLPEKFSAWLGLNKEAAQRLAEMAKGEKKVIKFVPRDRARAAIADDLARVFNEVPLQRLTKLRDDLIAEKRDE